MNANRRTLDRDAGASSWTRTLIWNQAHLRQILRQYQAQHNQHRPHRSLHGAAPLKPLPEPAGLDPYRVRRQAHVAGLINEYHLVA
jgi:putative transposase